MHINDDDIMLADLKIEILTSSIIKKYLNQPYPLIIN